jgi:hypothetical protein
MVMPKSYDDIRPIEITPYAYMPPQEPLEDYPQYRIKGRMQIWWGQDTTMKAFGLYYTYWIYERVP